MSDDIFTPEGGRSVGIDILGSHYPFVQPPEEVRGVLSDAWFAYPENHCVPPIYVKELRNFSRPLGRQPAAEGQEHTCDIVLVDSEDTVVFDSSQGTYAGRAFGPRFYVHEWRVGALLCNVVQHTEVPEPPDGRRAVEDGDLRVIEDGVEERILEGEPPPWPATIHTHARLDERAIEQTPGRVFSIQVGSEYLTGNIVFCEGYNVRLGAGTSSGIGPSPGGGLISREGALDLDSFVLIEAIGGAGMGAAPGCDEVETGLVTVAGATPDQYGRVTISGQDCLFVTQPAIPGASGSLIPGTLQVGNHCTTCMDCGETDGREGDIIPAYNVITDLYNRGKAIGQLLEEVRLKYIEMVADWQDMAECRTGNVLTIQTVGSRVVGEANSGMASISVVVTLVNAGSTCIPGVDITITNSLDPERDTDGVLAGSAWIVDDNGSVSTLSVGASNTEFTFSFGQVRPGRGSSVQFVVVWLRGPTDPDNPLAAGPFLPEGDYTLCITSADADGTELIEDPICADGSL